MKFKPLPTGLTLGIIWGACVLLATFWVMIGPSEGETMKLLRIFYLGYSVSAIGAFIGLVWGFIDGFIGGFVFALLYNLFAKE